MFRHPSALNPLSGDGDPFTPGCVVIPCTIGWRFGIAGAWVDVSVSWSRIDIDWRRRCIYHRRSRIDVYRSRGIVVIAQGAA